MSKHKNSDDENYVVLLLAIMQSVQTDFNVGLYNLCKQYNEKMDLLKSLILSEFKDDK